MSSGGRNEKRYSESADTKASKGDILPFWRRFVCNLGFKTAKDRLLPYNPGLLL